MPVARRFTGPGWEGGTYFCKGVLKNENRILIVAGDLLNLDFWVDSLSTGLNVTAEAAITPIATYVTAPDANGQNFSYPVDESNFSASNKLHLVTFRFTTTGGFVGFGQWEVPTVATASLPTS